MSFSAEWLALREPVDHASRNAEIAARVAAHFAGQRLTRVVDLGCGTGSNLRATFSLLAARQEWLLVDYDPLLLVAARTQLMEWADRARPDDGYIQLVKDGRDLTVRFAKADLTRDMDKVLSGAPDLVTASALFDLISEEWMTEFARQVRAVSASFYTVLTYNGQDSFAPPHAQDAAVIRAFSAHQKSDKGFGPAAGPDGAAALKRAFDAVGYTVSEGDSPWRIGPQGADLATQLLQGIVSAVSETGTLSEDALGQWLTHRLMSVYRPDAMLLTGHTDTFATP